MTQLKNLCIQENTNLVSGIGSGRGILLVGSVMLEKSRPTWETSLAECDLFFFLSQVLQIGQRFVTRRSFNAKI